MLIVETKEQLKKAKQDKVKEFKVVGELAEKLYKARKVQKLSKASAVALAGVAGAGVVAAPFSFGTSLGVSAIAASSVGTGTIIAAGAAGGILLTFAIYKGYSFKVKINDKGEVEIVFTSKHHTHST
ncbi:hypothetical protein SAMN05216389_1431 [Oceanobacillus limi]|uniref:Uncharacterized protein n=1 Tax=Oceanobacillus limi TaxID=930131 RepID=A0A1I0HNP0_9BACI|nr:hypothetical protein [Oceanobacillus limi]SET85685.1 hypothetical protein SAMN05216389_1431 [Oceanobacillus limi]